jgi:hypothetical protein
MDEKNTGQVPDGKLFLSRQARLVAHCNWCRCTSTHAAERNLPVEAKGREVAGELSIHWLPLVPLMQLGREARNDVGQLVGAGVCHVGRV